MAQELSVLAALSEDLGSFPSTHIAAAHNYLTPIPRDLTASSGLLGHQQTWCNDTLAGNPTLHGLKKNPAQVILEFSQGSISVPVILLMVLPPSPFLLWGYEK